MSAKSTLTLYKLHYTYYKRKKTEDKRGEEWPDSSLNSN